MRRILCAADGSPVSEGPLALAAELARGVGAEPIGLFVIDNQWADFIGNDWQSSAGARQGFLDHMRREQEAQAELARAQVESALAGIDGARFELRVGDPTRMLLGLARDPDTELLVLSRRVFAVAGRPSLRGLARALAEGATRPLLLMA